MKQETIEIIKRILIDVFIICFIILMLVFSILLIEEETNTIFKEKCESKAGEYFLVQNVICDAMYPKCYMKCEIDGKTYDIYDKIWREIK